MLGVHNHAEGQHTWQEILANFLVVLAASLLTSFGITQALPSLECVYGAILTSVVTTGAMYGVNVYRARATEPKDGETDGQ